MRRRGAAVAIAYLRAARVRLQPYAGLSAVLVVATALHLPMLNDSFHGDDYVAFTQFRTTSFLEYCSMVFQFEDTNFYWRPLGKIFHRVLYEGFGLSPLVFHLAALLIFLSTLVTIYAFSRRQGLDAKVALGAVAIFALFPNHVVSVAWVTNTSRLMDVLFFMLCMLVLQSGIRNRPLRESLAWLLFLAAACSDETVLALAPVPIIYATFLRDREVSGRWLAGRVLAYGLMAALLVPLQFAHTGHDDARVGFYTLGTHAPAQFWALASQLTLPLAKVQPLDLYIWSIPPLQWAAGLVAIVAGVGLFCVGSKELRFLILWTGMALTPFALWDLNYTTPRYVYMAALPYSIIVSWGLVTIYGVVTSRAASIRPLPLQLRRGMSAAMVVGGLALALLFVQTDMARNEAWGRETGKYGQLERNLRRELPSMPVNARIYIVYEDLPDFWASSLAQTVYGDTSIRIIGVASSENLSRLPPRKGDVLMYNIGPSLIPAVPSLAKVGLSQPTSTE